MTAYLEVMLRGLGLAAQAVAVGGVVFLIWLLPASHRRRCSALTTAGALTAGGAQALVIFVQLIALAEQGEWPIRVFLAIAWFRASAVRLLACVAIAIGCFRIMRQGHVSILSTTLLIVSGTALVGSSAWLSHAAARMHGRAVLLGLDAFHQIAACVWVGGLIHLVALWWRRGELAWLITPVRRFSTVAMIAVPSLVVAGTGLTFAYMDGIHALFGTAYGVMVLTKSAILIGLLGFGGMNFLTVRRLSDGSGVSLARLRPFVEVEVGLGVTVLFVAASLSSLPPAVDVVAERATLAEVGSRFTPKWPTLHSPSIEAARVTNPEAPRSAEDRAWSEYNHHYAGFFVITMGLLAIAERMGWALWPRHWPSIFIALAGFLFMRNDPEVWPLGPVGFWASMADPVVLQHRIFVLLIVAFGVFEWRVRTGRVRSQRYDFVFPMLCVISGGLLLAHFHVGDGLKDQFLIEVTHAPLGILATIVGWTRWLQLRLDPPGARLPGRLWAFGFTLVGVLLVLYRER